MQDWISANTVVEWKSNNADEKGYIERILWTDPLQDIVVTIALEDEKAMPQIRTLEEYTGNLVDQKHRVIDWLASKSLLVSEDSISEKNKQIRDKAWQAIGSIVVQEPDIYNPKLRGVLVAEIIEQEKIHKSTLYRYLRRYWQGGKAINTLLPFYDNCGGNGQERAANEAKRGRPHKLVEESAGVNVTEEIKQLFRSGIRLFYNTKDRAPLKRAYQQTLEKFFYNGYRYDGTVAIPILPPQEQLPSFIQFKYWFEKELDLKETLTKRFGKKNYELKYRQILGSSTYESFGPGSRFQIDATIADVYLVSEYKREWIIGRPIIYVVIDVFSRMVTGLYVGLEGPSWLGAMMALANTTADKVKYCAQYGIEIEPDEWVSSHLPQKLTSDRGELEGVMPTNLISALSVDVETEPPYRADWKGVVEQQFRLLNLRSIRWIPGAVQARMKERGERDYRLDAKLTLSEFTKIMIHSVLYHNNGHYMNWYDRNEFLVKDDIEPIPRELWNWGIENRTGRLKKVNEDIVKLNLLNQGTATVTSSGILFKGMSYSCEMALQEQWFPKARVKGSWKVPVCYDPRTTNEIYLWLERGRKFETCLLLEREERYLNRRFEEVEDLLEIEKHQIRQKSDGTMRAKIELDAHSKAIVKEATAKTDEAVQNSELSNRNRIKNSRQRRLLEKEINRETEVFTLGKSKDIQDSQAKVLPFVKQSEKSELEYIPPLKKTSRIQAILNENDGEEK